MNQLEWLTKQLIVELFENAKGLETCPYIKKMKKDGAYCGKGLNDSAEPNEARQNVCDTASLQLWCLNPENYQNCIYFKGEPL
mgnify:CR=1 FL=1